MTKMKPKHLKIEKDFYDEAYRDPATRLERGYGWAKTPSPSMVTLSKKIRPKIPRYYRKILDIGIGADGRNAKYFMNQGHWVYGIDISEIALDHCKINLKKYLENDQLQLHTRDMSVPKVLETICGKMTFNVIIDWSVMDHIRRAYLPKYKKNILDHLKVGGYLISSQFADPLPKKFKVSKGKDYCLWGKHYMRCFTIGKLIAEFPTLKVIDYMENCPEDAINGIKIHSVLFQKVA